MLPRSGAHAAVGKRGDEQASGVQPPRGVGTRDEGAVTG